MIEIVERAGARLDAIVLPKVSGPGEVVWLDVLLNQVELAAGLAPGRIGIEAQIEDAAGLAAVDQIAVASSRLAALVFGPADFMASLGMRSLSIGSQPGGYAGADAFHYAHLRILVAARTAGLQAIDGPFAAIGDLAGLGSAAASVAALGYDGKWVVHPDQIDAGERGVLAQPGRIRPCGADTRGLRARDVGAAARRRHARQRDDRRGDAQARARGRGPWPRRWPDEAFTVAPG